MSIETQKIMLLRNTIALYSVLFAIVVCAFGCRIEMSSIVTDLHRIEILYNGVDSIGRTTVCRFALNQEQKDKFFSLYEKKERTQTVSSKVAYCNYRINIISTSGTQDINVTYTKYGGVYFNIAFEKYKIDQLDIYLQDILNKNGIDIMQLAYCR